MEQIDYRELFWVPNWGEDSIDLVVAELIKSGGSYPFERWNENPGAFEYLTSAGIEYFADEICELLSSGEENYSFYHSLVFGLLVSPWDVEWMQEKILDISAKARGKIFDTLKVRLPEMAKRDSWIYVEETLELWNPGRQPKK